MCVEKRNIARMARKDASLSQRAGSGSFRKDSFLWMSATPDNLVVLRRLEVEEVSTFCFSLLKGRDAGSSWLSTWSFWNLWPRFINYLYFYPY